MDSPLSYRNPRPLYVWQDTCRKLHVLLCRQRLDHQSACVCHQELESVLQSHLPFVWLRITESGTHEASCPRITSLCSCRYNGFPNYVQVQHAIHRIDCLVKTCDGTCTLDHLLPASVYIPPSMPPRNSLWWCEHNQFLHVFPCRGDMPCTCTQTLFACGYYRVRLSIHGPHVTQCPRSVDIGPYAKDPFHLCQCFKLLKEQYPRSSTRQDIDDDDMATAFNHLYCHVNES
ncbi:hypothetical protein JTE90_010249 [Oedothorax gibbosus]|uniref:Uncharacterized protein n=1 Tax=Oedothorax gibbosus TaxID=931172 RepID=A0AAV6TM44_9ARAC|nr:hypothetical protein JTE90_010245 [Oedothorax gibbosus]KAG8172856.1 hypothetical protein JTE90_010249 [Oedothorax gibbosus]